MIFRLFESAVIAAPADAVWQIVRDFTSPPLWASEIIACEMEDAAGPSDIGAVRRMTFDFGATARERLAALSDAERWLEYELLPPEEVPFLGYEGRMQVVPITATDQSLMTWRSSFVAAPGGEDAAAGLGKAYQSGMRGIARLLMSGETR